MEFYSYVGKAILATVGIVVAGLCVAGIALVPIALIGRFDIDPFLGILGAVGGVPVWAFIVWLRRKLLRQNRQDK